MTPPPPPPPPASVSAAPLTAAATPTPATAQDEPAIRLAILECDTPIEAVQARHGDYGDIFTALLRASADTLPPEERPTLDISKWDVVTEQKYPALEDVDAVLLTGSRHCAFDNDPWITKLVDFVAEILDRQEQDRVAKLRDQQNQDGASANATASNPPAPRIIGVCFGHQIVGRAMGFSLGRSDAGWEVSVLPMDLTEVGKEIFGKSPLHIHQMHRDVVLGLTENPSPSYLPAGALRLGSTPKCRFHGLYVPRRALTIQGHPEFNEDIIREVLRTRHRQGIFDDATFEDAMSRIAKPHDGGVVAVAFLRFLRE